MEAQLATALPATGFQFISAGVACSKAQEMDEDLQEGDVFIVAAAASADAPLAPRAPARSLLQQWVEAFGFMSPDEQTEAVSLLRLRHSSSQALAGLGGKRAGRDAPSSSERRSAADRPRPSPRSAQGLKSPKRGQAPSPRQTGSAGRSHPGPERIQMAPWSPAGKVPTGRGVDAPVGNLDARLREMYAEVTVYRLSRRGVLMAARAFPCRYDHEESPARPSSSPASAKSAKKAVSRLHQTGTVASVMRANQAGSVRDVMRCSQSGDRYPDGGSSPGQPRGRAHTPEHYPDGTVLARGGSASSATLNRFAYQLREYGGSQFRDIRIDGEPEEPQGSHDDEGLGHEGIGVGSDGGDRPSAALHIDGYLRQHLAAPPRSPSHRDLPSPSASELCRASPPSSLAAARPGSRCSAGSIENEPSPIAFGSGRPQRPDAAVRGHSTNTGRIGGKGEIPGVY